MGGAAAAHPTDQTLQAYGLGELEDALAESVSKHLEDCPSCQSRVAELSSDDFLGRLRIAQGSPEMSATNRSQVGGSNTDRGPAVAIAPPAAGTLPPGLADHPDYEVIRELGRGGMGVVYLAQNKLMGRPEVLKVVGSHLIERPGVLDRFLREIRSAAKLHHTNIVTAYAALRLGESLILAMEYVDGLDLAKMVKTKGPLPIAHACSFIHQAALGLQHAHERGMVHRDIKPANLILAPEGKKAVVKVLDFGLAKVTSEGQADSGLTREGQMLGTPDYIAPEQIRDAQSADIRADIYSLGCTFYYLLTGGPPFRGDSLWDLYQAHFSMDAGPLNLVRPEIPVELAALVAKMMAKEPGRRFQTPGEVAQALTPFFKKGSVAVKGANAEISQAGQPGATQSAPRPVSVPTRPAMERTPAPVSGARNPGPTQPGSIVEGLIDLRETQPLFDRILDTPLPVAAPAASRRNLRPWSTAYEKLSWSGPRAWWAAAGVLLLGFVVAWAVVLRVKTANGIIELVNLPKDAEVLVDGEEVAVTWPGGGKPAVVTLTAGKHKIMVKKDGLEISGDEVTVQAEGREKFTVRFVPPTKPAHELSKDGRQAPISNSIGMTLKLIPAGEFFMGSPDDAIEAEKDEKPSHRVRISKPFYL
ncbi:MAG TPA: protein kinase, partial [Isosphaeraceae bacterium]|nr:protein kinase [Isosphaeraceae bacterium]